MEATVVQQEQQQQQQQSQSNNLQPSSTSYNNTPQYKPSQPSSNTNQAGSYSSPTRVDNSSNLDNTAKVYN